MAMYLSCDLGDTVSKRGHSKLQRRSISQQLSQLTLDKLTISYSNRIRPYQLRKPTEIAPSSTQPKWYARHAASRVNIMLISLQAQTPQQRMSNQKFAKENTAKMGKPEGALKKKQQSFKSPVSPIWLGMSNHYTTSPTALHC